MMKYINTPIKVYRDGQLDRVATYKPLIKRNLVILGTKIDRWFTGDR